MNRRLIFTFLLLDSYLLLICQGNVQVSVFYQIQLQNVNINFFQAFQSTSENPEARTFDSIDQVTVYNNFYDPNQILIHVSNNFFNFASSTTAWLVTAAFYEARNVNAKRKKRFALDDSKIDPATIYTGVHDPNNILIHVSRNFFNFASSSIAWFMVAAFFDNGGSLERRMKRSLNSTDTKETLESRFSGERLANVFRSMASTAESLDR